MVRTDASARWARLCVACLTVSSVLSPAVRGEFDPAHYIGPDELRPGMTGYGKTVMSGTKIERFNFEVISVMHNAWYAKKDVILVRCSGLNLEYSGIIGGMSGSPCYIVDEDGNERMVGAVAFGWTFNKDPICGLQPITQMIDVAETRKPRGVTQEEADASADRGKSPGSGLDLGEIVAGRQLDPLPAYSRFSLFNEDISRHRGEEDKPQPLPEGLTPLTVPVMISGAHPESIRLLRDTCRRHNLPFEFVSAGATTKAAAEDFGDVKLEPGSAICVPFITGDLQMDAFGTCTEVVGDQVLGFGHALYAEGKVEYPVATGMVHTVIPSVARSNKLGASLESVGTLLGDETSAIYGITGRKPHTVPFDVEITDIRGTRTYHYDMVHEQVFTPMLLSMAAYESMLANNAPPLENTITYHAEVEFEDIGTLRLGDMTSMQGSSGMAGDLQVPTMTLMDSPFGKAKVKRASAKITVERGANRASVDEARISKNLFKPGETASIAVRWFHHYSKPRYTDATYTIDIPEDLPDGNYTIRLASTAAHLSALRSEKPYLFQVENLEQMLKAYNLLTKYPQNRMFVRLELPTGGVAVKRLTMPELPAFRQQILKDTQRSDLSAFTDARVEEYATDFAASGGASFNITVSRRADQ